MIQTQETKTDDILKDPALNKAEIPASESEAEDIEDAEEAEDIEEAEEAEDAEDIEEAEDAEAAEEFDDAEKSVPNIKLSQVLRNYLSETRWLVNALKTQPEMPRELLRVLSITKDNSRMLGFTPVYKLYKGLEDLYKSIVDKKTLLSDNVRVLIAVTAEKISEMCVLIEKDNIDELHSIDIHPYLLYLDKAVVGEIFDVMQLLSNKSFTKGKEPARLTSNHDEEELIDTPVELRSSEIASLINLHEEMIARSYIIMNQVELLKNALYIGDIKAAKESYKQLDADAQNLQGSLRRTHDQLMSFMKDSSFLESHQEFNGFFVLANDRKYLIPSQFVVDVISETPLNYEKRQNQNYIVYIQENELGTEKDREEIPVYSLSSLLPGKPAKKHSVMDTIIIVECLSQKIGIIVDSLQKFVSLIKLPMPPAFSNFKFLRGLAFDEKYDMIPILSVPGIMKKLFAFRSYDMKKFEAITKKKTYHILVVDDSDTTRLIEHTILESNGYSVEEAFDGIDALAKIKEMHVDLILCDDDMPRMNGDIFIENIRRMERTKNAPVIAISENEIPRADFFMSKADFKRDILIEKIKELLNE
ncbi:MAG: response regulator [Treponema sp.]|nr:response regulator [Treponema sp.]